MEATAPQQKAVIVVDIQKDNVGRYCQPIIPNVKLLLREARDKGCPGHLRLRQQISGRLHLQERASAAHHSGNRGSESHRRAGAWNG